MASKKDTRAVVALGDSAQVERLLGQRHEIAEALHNSTSRGQAERALAGISAADEATQMALLKALTRQRDTDAADVLLAINELSSNKVVRKESRRALIQLAGAKIYPSWTPEPESVPGPVVVEHPPRFWKGLVTQTREQGQVRLILCWEQGFEYGEARMMSFVLDFWMEGVKEFLTEVGSKRRIDSRIQEVKTAFTTESETEVKVVDCTLAEGRRLLQDALAVDEWRGSKPHKDYRHYQPTVQQLVLNATDVGEDRGRTFINPDLHPDEVVANFVGAWSLGDYELCYDLLASGSDLLEGLSRDEWVDTRRKWADEARPRRFAIGFIDEREHDQQALWLPSSVLSNRAAVQREVEVSWSIELRATPLSGTLPEMPLGTAVYKETGRHWFWTSYRLVQEEDAWRLSRMTDEGAGAQGLPITEIQQRLKEQDDRIDEIVHEHSATGADVQQYYEEVIRRTIEAMHYVDALLVKSPFDRSLYEDAIGRAMGLNWVERAAVYAEELADRFASTIQHGEDLRQLGAIQLAIAEQYGQTGVAERTDHFFERAEYNIEQSLIVEDHALGHILLAELRIEEGAYDEAEAELEKARPLVSNREEEAQVEYALGNIALQREQFDTARQYFERVAEIKPDYSGIWFYIGYTYRVQKNYAEAETYYKRAIGAEPHDIRPYSELSSVYMNTDRWSEAVDILLQGVNANPGSAHLRALLAGVVHEMGDTRNARKLLEQAERMNPNLEIVQSMRRTMDAPRKR